jgi:hypothetical protein
MTNYSEDNLLLYKEYKSKGKLKLHENVINYWKTKPEKTFLYIRMNYPDIKICKLIRNPSCSDLECSSCTLRFFDWEKDEINKEELCLYLAERKI